MTKFWPVFGAFLLWSLFAIVVHEYLSNSLLGECAVSHNSVASDTSFEEPSEVIPEVIPDTSSTENSKENEPAPKAAEGNLVFNYKKGFEISALNGSVVIPKEAEGLTDSVYNYLNKNQNQELVIGVKHLASEADINGVHLGNLRAEAVIKLFIDAGINPNKIIMNVKESTYEYDTSNHAYDAVSLEFNTISESRLAEVEKGIANKTLYSNFAVKEFLPDKKLIAYTIELKNYLEKYPNRKVYVEGHTDSVGNNNYAFGLGRANNVKDYLISQDISSSIIITSSKGESAPIADNYSEAGRAKNRRIEITIK